VKIKTSIYIRAVFVGLICLICYVYVFCREAILEIYVYDLTGSPTVMVRTPDDRRYVINGGSTREFQRLIGRIVPFYSRRIDGLIVSGWSPKYSTGFMSLLDRYDIGAIIFPEKIETFDQKDPLSYEAHKKNIKLIYLTRGDVIDFGRMTSAQALFPVSTSTFKYSNASPPELVLSLNYLGQNLYIFGLASEKIRKFIMKDLVETDYIIGRKIHINGKTYKLDKKSFYKITFREGQWQIGNIKK